MSNYVAYQLKQSDIFAEVDIADLEALAEKMTRHSYEAGDIVFRQNDYGQEMYIILKGKVRIYSEENPNLTYMHYGASQIFGEFSLIDSKPRSASAAAADELEVMSLNKSTLLEFLDHRPTVALAMMRTLADRARYTTTYLEQVVTWTKTLANGQYDEVLLSLEHTPGQTNQIKSLVANFLSMIQNMQTRENDLREEVIRLQAQVSASDREASHQRLDKDLEDQHSIFKSLKDQLDSGSTDPTHF